MQPDAGADPDAESRAVTRRAGGASARAAFARGAFARGVLARAALARAAFARAATFAAAGLVAAMLVAAGCGPGAATQVPSTLPTVAPTPRPPDKPVATPPSVIAVPPSILEAVVAEAARLASVPADQVAVVRAEPAVWSDGSLGCPQPDTMYTQAIVNGYWIILQAGTVPYDFRVANDGSFTLCPHPDSSDSADN
jgi:hypothetical protein